MKENRAEIQLKKILKANNINCYSLDAKKGSKSGVADLELIYNKKVFKLELKVDGNKLTKNQKMYLTLLPNSYVGTWSSKFKVWLFYNYLTKEKLFLEDFIKTIKE